MSSKSTTTNQSGRRTPLSHSGGATQNDRGVNSSNSSAGQTNNTKGENKNRSEKQQTNVVPKEQQATGPKENPTKLLQTKQTAVNADSKVPKQQEQPLSGHSKSHKLTNQNDKTQQQPQNGVSSNNLKKVAENQQGQITKDKQPNANAEVKPTEMDKSESKSTQDKHEMKEKDTNNKNDAKEMNKVPKKSDKDKQKQQNDKKKSESKKDKEIILEGNFYNEVKQKEHSYIEKKTVKNAEAKDNCNDNKDSDKATTKDGNVLENTIAMPHQQEQQHSKDASAPSTPKLVKNSKQSTPNKPTHTKTTETPPKKPQTKQDVTTCIDDYEMESLKVECSPSKQEIKKKNTSYSTFEDCPLQKSVEKTDVQLVMQPSVSEENRFAFSRISGRRAIHPITGYTPSKLHSNLQYRESYRSTELDITNSSLNVTVGSDISNNTSLERGRKRGCTLQQHSPSAMGKMQNNEMEISPHKRPRMAFFSVVSSPLSMLRNRFSKATLQSSTPVKLQQKCEETEDDDEVQNVSSESVLEDIEKFDSEQVSVGGKHTSVGEAATTSVKTQIEGKLEIHDGKDTEFAMKTSYKPMSDDDDIKMIESELQAASGYTSSKNKRCVVM